MTCIQCMWCITCSLHMCEPLTPGLADYCRRCATWLHSSTVHMAGFAGCTGATKAAAALHDPTHLAACARLDHWACAALWAFPALTCMTSTAVHAKCTGTYVRAWIINSSASAACWAFPALTCVVDCSVCQVRRYMQLVPEKMSTSLAIHPYCMGQLMCRKVDSAASLMALKTTSSVSLVIGI